MMNRDSVYSRRRAFMNRTCSGYLRMSVGGSRESMDEDLDDASSDAGSIRSTASTRSWRKSRNRRNRRTRPPMERAQSLFGDTSTENLHFNVNRPNIDPFTFGLRRTPITSATDIRRADGDINTFRNRNLESSSSVDSENLRHDPLDRDLDCDVYNELSTIAQSPVEAYYSSSSLDTSSDDDADAVVQPFHRSGDHKDTHDWLMTGSFGSNQHEVPKGKSVAPRVNIVEKTKTNPKALGIHQGVTGGGLNELLTIIKSESSTTMDESSNGATSDLDKSRVTDLVSSALETRESVGKKERTSTREAWEKGDSGALERMRDEAEESFGVFDIEPQMSQFAEDAKVVSSTPSDIKPPSFDESEILQPVVNLSYPDQQPDVTPYSMDRVEASNDLSSAEVQLYSVKDMSVKTGSLEAEADEGKPTLETSSVEANDLIGNNLDFDDVAVVDSMKEPSEIKRTSEEKSNGVVEQMNNPYPVVTPDTVESVEVMQEKDLTSPELDLNIVDDQSHQADPKTDVATPACEQSPEHRTKNAFSSNVQKDTQVVSEKEVSSSELNPNPVGSSDLEEQDLNHVAVPPTHDPSLFDSSQMTSSRDVYRPTTLEVVMEEETLPGEEDPLTATKKKQSAFAENLNELNMDLREEDFYVDAKEDDRCLATLEEENCTSDYDITDDDAVVDEVEEMLITDDDRVGQPEKIVTIEEVPQESRIESCTTYLQANTTDETDETKDHVVNNAPTSSSHARRKKSFPITTSDKSGLCSCCLVM